MVALIGVRTIGTALAGDGDETQTKIARHVGGSH
jgi:hypothetical protein